MSKAKKDESATSTIIVIGSIILSVGMANPMPFIVAVLFVWIFGNKF